MTYQEYMEEYGKGFCHENYLDGERSEVDLQDLLDRLKEHGNPCPDEVEGCIPVKMILDSEYMVDRIEEYLQDEEYAGEDYEITKEGRAFLLRCFEEYNEKYADYGNYCDTVTVEVPDEMKYEMEDEE